MRISDWSAYVCSSDLSSDNTARPYAQHLSDFFGEQFVIENRGGAGGTIGADVAAQAKPDGYTLFLTPTAVLTIKPNVVETLAYTPLEDFQPISRVSVSIGAIGVHHSVPANTIQDRIAPPKTKTGRLHFGTEGMGKTPPRPGERCTEHNRPQH